MLQSLRDGLMQLPAGYFFYSLIFKVAPVIAFLYYFGNVLAPFFIAAIVAYIFVSLDKELVKKGVSSTISMYIVTSGLLLLFGGIAVYMAPLIWEQSINFAKEIPGLYGDFRVWLTSFTQQYLGDQSKDVVNSIFKHFGENIGSVANTIANNTFGSLMNIGVISLYAVIIPLLVYFFIKDRDLIIAFMSRFVPKNIETKQNFSYYWSHIDGQLSNYIQGKILEILIIGGISFFLFASVGLKYTVLLATAVGLSVLIPFVGALAVTIPVVAVAFSQFGFETQFFVITIAYFILQILDGNVLVPLIFSEKMNIHPAAILLAVLLFGAIGGIAGVFFAIPLIALAKIYIDKNYPVEV